MLSLRTMLLSLCLVTFLGCPPGGPMMNTGGGGGGATAGGGGGAGGGGAMGGGGGSTSSDAGGSVTCADLCANAGACSATCNEACARASREAANTSCTMALEGYITCGRNAGTCTATNYNVTGCDAAAAGLESCVAAGLTCANFCARAARETSCAGTCLTACNTTRLLSQQAGCVAQLDALFRCHLGNTAPFTCSGPDLQPPSGCTTEQSAWAECTNRPTTFDAGTAGLATCDEFSTPTLISTNLDNTTSVRIKVLIDGSLLLAWNKGDDLHAVVLEANQSLGQEDVASLAYELIGFDVAGTTQGVIAYSTKVSGSIYTYVTATSLASATQQPTAVATSLPVGHQVFSTGPAPLSLFRATASGLEEFEVDGSNSPPEQVSDAGNGAIIAARRSGPRRLVLSINANGEVHLYLRDSATLNQRLGLYALGSAPIVGQLPRDDSGALIATSLTLSNGDLGVVAYEGTASALNQHELARRSDGGTIYPLGALAGTGGAKRVLWHDAEAATIYVSDLNGGSWTTRSLVTTNDVVPRFHSLAPDRGLLHYATAAGAPQRMEVQVNAHGPSVSAGAFDGTVSGVLFSGNDDFASGTPTVGAARIDTSPDGGLALYGAICR